MRVTFVLPGYSPVPVGGVKIVYEYANRLQARGHQVTVVHPMKAEPLKSLTDRLKSHLWPHKMKMSEGPLVPWLPMNPDVQLKLVPDLHERHIPDGDAIIASAWQTVEPVYHLSPQKGKPYYFIQHYETWSGPTPAVDATWQLPIHKIVIARWLEEKARSFSDAPVTYIPNGMDFDHFALLKPIQPREPHVGMLYHTADWKGTHDGLKALMTAKDAYPELKATLFGTEAPPADLPSWITYVQRPAPEQLRDLYNSWSIFLHPSWAEGWPLPPAEAMSCGCALVAAGNPGVLDYATDLTTAAVAPIQQPDLLAQQLMDLLANDMRRVELAIAGHKSIRHYTWERAVNAFESLIVGNPNIPQV